MIHYSCDSCGRDLRPQENLRYVVKLEAYAAMDPYDSDRLDDERDHLLELDEILERADDAQCEAVGDDVYQKCRYDLCPACYKKFASDPFGHERVGQLGFSHN